MWIIAESIKMNKSRASWISEVCEMSRNQYGWPQRKNFKNSTFILKSACFMLQVEWKSIPWRKWNWTGKHLQKKSVKPMRFKDISTSVWLISTRDFQTMYLQSVKPVAFIYVNIFSGKQLSYAVSCSKYGFQIVS